MGTFWPLGVRIQNRAGLLLPVQVAERTRLGTHSQQGPVPQVCTCARTRVWLQSCVSAVPTRVLVHMHVCVCVTSHVPTSRYILTCTGTGSGIVFTEPLTMPTDARPHRAACPGPHLECPGGPGIGGWVPFPDVTASHRDLSHLYPQSQSPSQPLWIWPAV